MKGNLIMSAENMQAFESCMDRLHSSLLEMRRVADSMMPEVLYKHGLDTALRERCIQISSSGILEVSYHGSALKDWQIGQTTAITLFRVAEELMNNVIMHAAARTVDVQLIRTDGHLTLTVKDDGRGFDPISPEFTKGTGWQTIRNRLELLKGRTDIQSVPGKGSSVMIVINI